MAVSAGYCAFMDAMEKRDARDKLTAQYGGPVTCPQCGGKMYVREGKHGPFYGCENYPRCQCIGKIKQARESDYTASFNSSDDLKCPECGGRMYKRQGRYGEFYGCVNYPNCKGTRKIK